MLHLRTTHLPLLLPLALAAVLCVLPGGCGHSPYHDALSDLERPMAERLADRVSDTARRCEDALEHFEDTAALLAAPADDTLLQRQDATERCAWWVFDLERRVLSIEDLLAEGDDAQARALVDDFRHATRIMEAVSAEFSAAVSHSNAPTPDAFDLQPLRDAVDHAVQRADAFAGESASAAGDPHET
jgi:hypothetical protein